MNQYVALRSSWRRAFLPALVGAAASLLAPGPSFADIPPQSYTQNTSNAVGAAASQKLLADAQLALAKGDTRLALIYLKNAASLAPRNTTVRIELGKALLQAGRPADAEAELRQAGRDGAPLAAVLPPLAQAMIARNEAQYLLDQFPEPAPGTPAAAEILKGRALALQQLRRGPEALTAMDRSLALRRDMDGVLMRARLSLLQGDLAAADKTIDEAIQTWPDDPQAMLFKLEMLLMARDNVGALNLAEQMTSRFPANLPAQFARIEAYLRLNQDAKAKAEIDTMLAEKPKMMMASYYRAVLMARAGNIKAAWGLAQTLPHEFLDADTGIAGMVAQMAVSAGDTETGASMLARMLKADPSQLGVRVRLAALRVRQNSLGTALNVLRPVQDSTNPQVARLLALIYLQMKRPREALDALKRLDAGPGANAAVKRGIAQLELQLGNPDEAIKTLTAAVAMAPANPIVVTPLLDMLMQKGQLGEALAIADKFAQDPKQRVQALVYRASIQILQHDSSGANASLEKALAIDPRSKAALYARASLQEAQRKYDGARRDLTTLLAVDGKDMPATLKLAGIAVRQGDYPGARRLLDQAVALAPQDSKSRIALARYLVSRRDMKGALAAAGDCVRAQAADPDCVLELGRIQSAMGQKKEALVSFRRYAYLEPQLPAAHLMLGAALTLAGDRAGAARAFDTAVDLAPNAPNVKQAQINYQFAQSKPEAALTLARDFQINFPGTISDMLLADTLFRAKQGDEALAVLNKSLAARPNNAVLERLVGLSDHKHAGDLMRGWLAKNPADQKVRLDFAAFLLRQGDNAQAATQYQAVLKQDPDQVMALNNLGWLVQRDDPKRALMLLTRAASLAPNSAAVSDTLGWLKLQQKDAAGALALLERAHALQPGDGQITYHLAAALDANAKRDEARKLLQSLLASGAKFQDRPAALQLSSTLALRPSR